MDEAFQAKVAQQVRATFDGLDLTHDEKAFAEPLGNYLALQAADAFQQANTMTFMEPPLLAFDAMRAIFALCLKPDADKPTRDWVASFESSLTPKEMRFAEQGALKLSGEAFEEFTGKSQTTPMRPTAMIGAYALAFISIDALISLKREKGRPGLF